MYLQTADAAVIVFDSREVDSQMKSINLMRRVRKMRGKTNSNYCIHKSQWYPCNNRPIIIGASYIHTSKFIVSDLAYNNRFSSIAASLPIALVTSKCDDGPVCKGPTHSFFPHISTSVSTGLGLGELEKAVTRLSFPDLVKRQDRWDRITSTLQRTLSGIKSHSSDALQNLQRCIASRPTVTRSLSSNAARGRTPFNKPAFRFHRISFSWHYIFTLI